MSTSAWRGWLLRRVVVAPLVVVLAVLVIPMAALVVAVGSAVICPLLAVISHDVPRWRLLRVALFATVYALGEVLGMVVCLVLWAGSGLGLRLRSRAAVRIHLVMLRLFLGMLLLVARSVFGFHLVVREPRHPGDLLRAEGAAPVLVLARHAGPGASFALVHLLLSRYGRHPRVVLKEQLRLDPIVDLLLSRTGCTWLPAPRGRGAAAVRMVSATAAGLQPRQAFVLFPEGADWTPARHLAAVARLRDRGLRREALRALGMPHVLPPRPAGAMAALQAAPHADVLVFTHAGHDELLGAVSAWRALPLRRPLVMAWWRAAAGEVPGSDTDAVEAWLQDTWTDIDAWVGEQQDLAELAPRAASPTHSNR